MPNNMRPRRVNYSIVHKCAESPRYASARKIVLEDQEETIVTVELLKYIANDESSIRLLLFRLFRSEVTATDGGFVRTSFPGQFRIV